MADYAPTLWVDEVTATSAANFNKMEAGIADAAQSKQRGAIADRPPASPATKNWMWVESDSGQLSYCDGFTWRDVGKSSPADQFPDLVADTNVAGMVVGATRWPVATVDGVSTTGKTVLLIGQTDQTQNGLWAMVGGGIVAPRLVRVDPSNYVKGQRFWVRTGTVYGSSFFTYVGNDSPRVGQDSLVFRFGSIDDRQPLIVPINGQASYTFGFLNGQYQKGYDLELVGRYVMPTAVNRYITLQPNADTGARYSGIDHFDYVDTNNALFHNVQFQQNAGGTGMLIGQSDWNASGMLQSKARFYAEGIAGSRGRTCAADWTFRPDAPTDGRIMRHLCSAYWDATYAPGGNPSPYSDTTPVTSLTVQFGGGTFTGTLLLRPWVTP